MSQENIARNETVMKDKNMKQHLAQEMKKQIFFAGIFLNEIVNSSRGKLAVQYDMQQRSARTLTSSLKYETTVGGSHNRDRAEIEIFSTRDDD